MSTLGSLAVSIIGDSRDLDKTLGGVTSKVQDFGRKMQAVGQNISAAGMKMTAAVTLPLVGIATGMAKAAMDLEATEAKYNTVFEGMTDVADAFIAKFKELTPATTAEARSMASGIQDLLVPMGFMREEATKLTGEFMHVAGALANFNSGTHTAQQVTDAMQSAILGMYRPLAGLGVQLDAATVKQKAVEMGLMEAGDEMTKQIATQVVLAEVYAQSGDALAAYTEENLDTKTKLALVKAELIDQAAAFGDLLLPMINKAVDFIKQLNEWLAKLTDGQRENILKWMALAAVIGPVLIIVGKLITAIGAILAVLSIKLIIIGLIIAAVVAIGIAIYKWVQENEEVKEKIMAAWETIKEGLSEVWELLQELARVVVEKIQEFWEKHGEKILEALEIVWDQIVLVVETAINIVKGIIKLVTAIIQGDWEGAWEAIKGIGETIWNFIKGSAENIFQLLQTALSGIWEGIKTKASEIWENIKQAVVNKAQEIYTNARQKLEDLWDYIKGLPGQALQWGRDILNSLWQGMKDKYNDIKQWFDDKVQALLNMLNPWAKSSPSLIDNIRSGIKEIEKAYSSIQLPAFTVNNAIAAVGADGNVSVHHVNFERMFDGANINVRSENDIKQISREIFNLFQSNLRGQGGSL